MTIYEQIGGRQIFVQVARGLNVRISARELQVCITNWQRNQIHYQIDLASQTDQSVVLKFKGNQDLLAEKLNPPQQKTT